MGNEQKDESHYGLVNFERRKFPRFNVDLPVEYERMGSFVPSGRAPNISEEGLLIYFSERMEVGQSLRIKLFFANLGSDFESIEAVVEVVWIELDADKELEAYRTGVRIVSISGDGLTCLKNFVLSLAQPPYAFPKRL